MSKHKPKTFLKFLKSIGYDGSISISKFIVNYIDEHEKAENAEIKNMNILTDVLINSKNPEIATPETIFRLRTYYANILNDENSHDGKAWELSKKLLRKAAALNHPEALCEVADDYYCDKKTQKAMELYHKAAELGSDEAMYALGSIYAKDWIEFINEEYYDDGIEMNNSNSSRLAILGIDLEFVMPKVMVLRKTKQRRSNVSKKTNTAMVTMNGRFRGLRILIQRKATKKKSSNIL